MSYINKNHPIAINAQLFPQNLQQKPYSDLFFNIFFMGEPVSALHGGVDLLNKEDAKRIL